MLSLPPVDGRRIGPDPYCKLPAREPHPAGRLPEPSGKAAGRLPGEIAEEVVESRAFWHGGRGRLEQKTPRPLVQARTLDAAGGNNGQKQLVASHTSLTPIRRR
jgi:hypothetical protein